MKVLTGVVSVALCIGLATASAVTAVEASPASEGSNLSGAEKVCFLSLNAQTDEGLQSALKSCRRGDVLDVGWLKTSIAMQLCDFTKTIVYNPEGKMVVACVYTGARRQVVK